MRKVTIFALSALFVFSATSAMAADITWNNNTGNSLWSDSGNWDLGRVPASDDVVYMDGGTAEVNTSDAVFYQNRSAGTININNGGVLTGTAPYTLRYITQINVNSGGYLPAGATWDIRCNDGITIAAGGVMTGTDNVGSYTYGGTLAVAGTFSPRDSASAGAFTVGASGGASYYAIFDLQSTGTLNLDVFGDGDNEYLDAIGENANTTVNLNTGTIVLNVQGGYTPQIGDSFDLWNQTNVSATMNVGDGSNVVLAGYTLDTSDWATSGIVTIVPEPMTMGLLAMGGLALLRKRRK